jgi:type 1 glutamine amidotransferase
MRLPAGRASAIAALAAAVAVSTGGVAQAQGDTTPPTVNVATLSPTPPTGHNNWYTGPVTLNLTATDDVGVVKFQYSLNGGTTYIDLPLAAPSTSASASAEITQEGATNVRYRAVDAAGNTAAFRQITVRVDTRTPLVSWPAIVNGHVGHAARLLPTRTDPAPGSGGVAVLHMYLDGEEVYPLPLSTSDLALGGHTLAVHLGDAAGNAVLHTQRFVVTTSFADVGTLIGTFATAGRVSADTAAALQSALADAKAFVDAGTPKKAKAPLNAFVSIANENVGDAAARDTLVADARYLIDELAGSLPPEPSTGLTSSPAEGPQKYPDPVLAPLPHNPDADYDVLVFSETTGFRHDHIPHTILAVQKLAREHNFNVDVYDPQLPSVSLPVSPFLSLDELSKYETIMFESTVGHSPGPLDPATERPNFEAYMRGGGGYVGLHGAADSARGNVESLRWPWYGNLVGGWFTNHPSGQNGFGHCGSCIHAEVITEDLEHPGTEHLDPEWMIVDELYNFDRHVRGDVHTLLSLDEESYRRSLNSGNAANNPLALMGGDHPIAWCQNWDGGKAFSNILGHARWLYYDESFMKIILGGIETTADRVEANCSSYRETALLIAAGAADGSLSEGGAASAATLLADAKTAYLAKRYTDAIPALNAIVELAGQESTGDAAARDQLAGQARALREWMQQINRPTGS